MTVSDSEFQDEMRDVRRDIDKLRDQLFASSAANDNHEPRPGKIIQFPGLDEKHEARLDFLEARVAEQAQLIEKLYGLIENIATA